MTRPGREERRICARPECRARFIAGGLRLNDGDRTLGAKYCSEECRCSDFNRINHLAERELRRRHPAEYAVIRAEIKKKRAGD